MATNWIHCNSCFKEPTQKAKGDDPKNRFLFTNCGHIYCCECVDPGTSGTCKLCGSKCRTMILNNNKLKPEIQVFFQDPKSLIKKGLDVLAFQQSHQRRLVAHKLKRGGASGTNTSNNNNSNHGNKAASSRLDTNRQERELMVMREEISYLRLMLGEKNQNPGNRIPSNRSPANTAHVSPRQHGPSTHPNVSPHQHGQPTLTHSTISQHHQYNVPTPPQSLSYSNVPVSVENSSAEHSSAHSVPVQAPPRHTHPVPRHAHSIPVQAPPRHTHSVPVQAPPRHTHLVPVQAPPRHAHSVPVQAPPRHDPQQTFRYHPPISQSASQQQLHTFKKSPYPQVVNASRPVPMNVDEAPVHMLADIRRPPDRLTIRTPPLGGKCGPIVPSPGDVARLSGCSTSTPVFAQAMDVQFTPRQSPSERPRPGYMSVAHPLPSFDSSPSSMSSNAGTPTQRNGNSPPSSISSTRHVSNVVPFTPGVVRESSLSRYKANMTRKN